MKFTIFYFYFYLLFHLFFNLNDSFFLNKLKNSRFFYNKHIKQLHKKKNSCNKKINYIVHHNLFNIQLEYNNITDYYYDNKFITGKNIINIYPAGLKGFYEMGMTLYIKENYNMENFIYSGASAGAWNTLLLAYKGNIIDFKNMINDLNFTKLRNIYELQMKLKTKILTRFVDNDFDFNKMYIGVTVLEKMRFKNYIFTDFESLEDALDCIIASSNIPFLTGKIIYKYRDKICFDGWFSKDSYIHHPNEKLIIDSNLFSEFNKLETINKIDEWVDFNNKWIDIHNNNIFENNFNILLKLFEKGYYDASTNVKFIEKNILNMN